MKYSTIVAAGLFLAVNTGFSQQHEIKLTSGTLKITEVDRVSIEGHSGSGIIIQVKGDAEQYQDERATGLREINARGLTDNTGLGLFQSTAGNVVKIEQLSPHSKERYIFKVPAGVAVSYEHSTHNGKKLMIKDVKGELEVSTHYNSVALSNCDGPMAINTVYGEIEADFTGVDLRQDIKLHSSYKHVDVTVPTSIKANFRLNTSYGKMFTDLELNMDRAGGGEMKEVNPHKITGQLNGGGIDFSITATYKNIYLRKG